ncbi:CobW family GTP-binding protein [Zavarzinia aquatilis]|uniref:CobW family GTP-binding protein n=1 Tax=Zavarzinia aquatilis TaxID=2211142 RepID=UPI001402F2D9|nr:GTP-binding protein [Zavarzinia aquatilis]
MVLTGFLGSGKTTLLSRMLASPDFADSAVIINELGDVGIDQDLVRMTSETVMVMPGGCVCCSIRGDVERALQRLFDDRDAGRIPPFRRLVIETTGIADPQPLLVTLRVNPLAASRLAPAMVVTVVDGILGRDTLATEVEAASQVAAADAIVVSKRDLGQDEALMPVLGDLNPWAGRRSANLLADPLGAILDGECRAGAFLGHFACQPSTISSSRHGDIRSHCLVLDEALDWTAFGVWMSMLLHRHGRNILRVKGLLNIEGASGPVAFHSAQHVVHPPQHLTAWPGDDRRGRIVFIVRKIEPALIEQSLKLFDATAKVTGDGGGRGGYLPAAAGGSIAGRPVRRPTAPRWLKG